MISPSGTWLARPRRHRRLGIVDLGSTSGRLVKAAQHERSELGLDKPDVVLQHARDRANYDLNNP